MATTVLQSSKVPVSGPCQLTPHQGINSKAPHASSSRSPQPEDVSDASSTSTSVTSSRPSTQAFGRIRSSLEQSLRSATRSKKAQTPSTDDFATITARQMKGKEKEAVSAVPHKEKEKTKMFRKLEPKVIFRRTGRETPSPLPPTPVEKDAAEKVRLAGFTSFVKPSMRQGSMSSPSLHLSSQAIPSPKSRPAIPVSSSSNNEIHATPTRDHTRQQSAQPPRREISSQTTLAPCREAPRQIIAGANQTPASRHRSTKYVPLSVPSTPPIPDGGTHSDDSGTQSPETPTPTRRAHDIPSPPVIPTPMSSSGQQLSRISSRRATTSSSHLPLNTPPASSISPRASSPVCARPTPRGLSSTSASYLPISPSSPRQSSTDSGPRRPSIDRSRRASGEAIRRASVDTPRRASIDIPRSPAESSSPSPRPRPVSPGQRLYMQNRYFNISSASLSGLPHPEYRELIRTASSMLCKEIIKISPHMSKSESGVKDWEDVKVRVYALARAERIWGESGVNAGDGSSNLVSPGGSGISASVAERERRLFAESLRDGYVLCQFMNKLRSASIVKPDARDDGVARISNITKFLAACSSYGLPEEELFLQDDLNEATGESLARVARTIIALVKFADTPVIDKSRILRGQGKMPSPILIPGPYQQGEASGRASASTLNLLQSPIPTSPVKRQHKQSDSPESTLKGVSRMEVDHSSLPQITTPVDHVVPHIMPSRRSPLSDKLPKSQRNDETQLTSWVKAAASPPRISLTDSTRASIGDDSEQYNPRQSAVSSAMTETTATTEISSILNFEHSSGGSNKYGTIRTVTTDMTSEAPSITRTEGSFIVEELTRKEVVETGAKHHRDRRSNEVAPVDLARVIEEGHDINSSSSQGKEKLRASEKYKVVVKPEKAPKVNLGKRIWPNDFMDAFQPHNPVRTITPKLMTLDQDQEESPKIATPVSVSPPRKSTIIDAIRSNDGVVSQVPLRPIHRTRQSVDTPRIFGHENSPDRITSPRVILRRHSTKPSMTGVPRNAVRFAPQNGGSRDSDNDSHVPFPRVAFVEPGGSSSHESPPKVIEEKPRIRGRFQSDINDSSSRQRVRPKSHDELGSRPLRSRIESMVNLGAGSANASASDLLVRSSEDGSAVRKTLIIREEGKPATHFQLGNCVGRGQFGSVYRALNLNTGQMVAVKRIRLEGLKESEIMTLMREVDLVKSLSHPSIVKYEGMARDADTLSIVLEYAESGSLGQTLKAFGKLNERLVASYVVKILEGLHYLHTNDVVHCDLKAANILTTKNGNVKLSDFGVSLNLRAMEREIKDVAGTPNWMAPEVIELKGPSPKSDIWSLACTVIELLTGRPPYADISNSMTVMYSIVEDDIPPLPPCSPLLRDFLTKCFNKDPRRRPNAEMLFEHPWLKQNWGIHKELRPQDSIPFLRRVSAELKNVRYWETLDPPGDDPTPRGDARGGPSQLGRRASDVSVRPPGSTVDSEISPREHQFVKTTFSKRQHLPKLVFEFSDAFILAMCAINAPPTCDLRSQLLLIAKYAEQGHTTSVYSNPADGLREDLKGPVSDVSYVAHSRTSIDAPTPTPRSPMPAQSTHPPTAYNKFMGFKRRSRQSLSPEPTSPPMSSSVPSVGVVKPKDEVPHRRKVQVLKKPPKDRPHSLSSDSTDPNSLRSAATPAESLSSRHEERSATSSEADTRRSDHSDAARTSQLTAKIEPFTYEATSRTGNIPSSLPVEIGRNKKREKSPGCSIQ
ncbi:hypothetical protein C0995_006431 [Termitomyces sp. Mi166|nr:hypothetical protein C0995_006431 [Termitomyces sp. Mi166\